MKHEKHYHEGYGNPEYQPFVPHADWPHSRVHRWNDTEMAAVTPFDRPCCPDEDADCMCITSGDVELWNSYSGLSALTAFDANQLSAAFDKLDTMDNYSAIENSVAVFEANSGVWNSAAYIPNIYENLSAINSTVNKKMDQSALSAWRVYTNGSQIVGLGTSERPLRISKELMSLFEALNIATDNLTVGLANQNDLDELKADIKALSKELNSQRAEINELRDMIKLLVNQKGK